MLPAPVIAQSPAVKARSEAVPLLPWHAPRRVAPAPLLPPVIATSAALAAGGSVESAGRAGASCDTGASGQLQIALAGFSVSGNLSRNGSQGCAATLGHTPGFWSTNLNANGTYRGSTRGSGFTPATLFSVAFAPLGSYPDGTFDAILKSGNMLDRALFAAVFLESSLHMADGFPTRDMIKDMWRAVAGNGLYPVPNTSLSWDKTAILKYLLYLTGQSVPG